MDIYLPFTKKSKRWKLKDVEVKRCENCGSRNLTYKFCNGTHFKLKILLSVDIVEDASIVGCMKLRKSKTEV